MSVTRDNQGSTGATGVAAERAAEVGSGPSQAALSDARLVDLLEKTSRTFAVSIPLLDEPTKRRVGLAYLLLRIADNFEDAASWPVGERVAALQRFKEAISCDAGSLSRSEVEAWQALRPQENEGYLELLGCTREVIEASRACGPGAWRIMAHHVGRSVDGMIDTVERSDASGAVELRSLDDLKHYCYLVAGIVGELLTELFVLAAPGLRTVEHELNSRAAVFGEGLQLVNIVKDAADDAVEGRRFLPEGVALEEVFALAREDLLVAQEYVELMRREGTPKGHLAFTALPVRLAWATLNQVEKRGAGAKVSRLAVARHLHAVRSAVKRDKPLFEAMANLS